ncbi:hypothetical protein NEOLEDRAFT_1129381, partial [Neolentinus lepideus HHB14362 ss-1]
MIKRLRIFTLFQRKAKGKATDIALEVEISPRQGWIGAGFDEEWHVRQSVEEETSSTMQLGDPLMQCLCPAFARSETETCGTWRGFKTAGNYPPVNEPTDKLRREQRSPNDILHDTLAEENINLHSVAAHTPCMVSCAAVVSSQAKIMDLAGPSTAELDTGQLPRPLSMTPALVPPIDHTGTAYEQMAHQLFFLDASLPASWSDDRLSATTESTMVDESAPCKGMEATTRTDFLQVKIPVGRLLSTDEMILPNPYDQKET